MNLTRRSLLSLMGLGGLAGLAACQRERAEEEPAEPTETAEEPVEPEVDLKEFEGLALDMDAWSYDEDHDCYYQLAVPYCLTPGSEQYESLAIFVPGPYFTGTAKGQLYHCELAEDAEVGQFTPATAPIALPINAPSCNAQECPTSYSHEGLGRYLDQGIVYVYAGFRGRSGGYESTTQEYFAGGAPWTVADLKAAVRFLRYNAAVLPCDTSRIFAFGLGGGGGAAALLGASGNAALYEPYLQELGVPTHDVEGNDVTDEIAGVAAWCPMSSFESSDAAYEWMMGQYASEGTRADGTWTKLLSDDLSDAYGDYVNALNLVDGDGQALKLDRIENGAYAGGTYYQHLVGVVSDAAADFIRRMEFPYAAVPLEARIRSFPGNPSLRVSDSADAQPGSSEASENPVGIAGVRQVEATVYDTLESYVATLNGDSRWLTYNASTGEVDVTGLWGFVSACRKPDKDVCAYDLLDRSGWANQLFGTDEQPSLHFDAMVATLVEGQAERYAQAEDWDEAVVKEWRGDLVEKDALDKTVAERVGMSEPIALLRSSDDEETPAVVAPHWRISTGLFQTETTLVGEVNLAAALKACKGVEDVSFQAVWGSGFELAEREGDPEEKLVEWIASCCPQTAEEENS